MQSDLLQAMSRLAMLPRDEAPAAEFSKGRWRKLFTLTEAAAILGIPESAIPTVVAAYDDRSAEREAARDAEAGRQPLQRPLKLWADRHRSRSVIMRHALQSCIAQILVYYPAWYTEATKAALVANNTIRGRVEWETPQPPSRPRSTPPPRSARPPGTIPDSEAALLRTLGISWTIYDAPTPFTPEPRTAPARSHSLLFDGCSACTVLLANHIPWDDFTHH